MCMPKPKKDNSAALAKAEEAARQARIAEGQTGIDNAFASFDDPFYQGYTTQYSDYYNPQLDDQYGDAVKRLTLSLAQSGNLTGSVGAKQLSDLQKHYDTQKMGITNQAAAATQGLRGNIDQRKSQLYADNRAAADPGSAAAAAASAVTALQPTAPASPLANVFGDFFSNIGNAAAIKNARAMSQGTGVQSFGGGSSGNKSVYNIG
jgi:hypothetical protein